jgi:hypothetical protein
VTEHDHDPEFFCDASGEASSGTPSFTFLVRKRFQSGGPDRELKLQVALEIRYEEHATPFEFDQDITSMVTHPNFLIRWAGWAVHNFNLQHHPPNLDSLIGQNHVRVYSMPRSSYPTQAEFQLLMKGLHASNSKVTVLKFRHPTCCYMVQSNMVLGGGEDGQTASAQFTVACASAGDYTVILTGNPVGDKVGNGFVNEGGSCSKCLPSNTPTRDMTP